MTARTSLPAGGDLPCCGDCGSTSGPFRPTGDRSEDGTQVLRCSRGCPTPAADAEAAEQAAAQQVVDRAFPAVAAFLAEDRAARPDADLMRADAPQANAPRVVTVRLLDTPGATLTVTCPTWCVSEHRDEAEHGTFAVDFTHYGRDSAVSVDGVEPILSARIAQSPFTSKGPEPVVMTWPEAGATNGQLSPDEVYALADQLRAYADTLDELAVDLDVARRAAAKNGGTGEQS
ncbi:hypothetical protein ABT040_30150 [Streptomyces sp. NPDC002688]|uniref:DUF6907 domain-containing protein n=1 Tax=Streptomyces sp. NPDC002688 TaxID=3154423 RepID=UPI00332DC3D5